MTADRDLIGRDDVSEELRRVVALLDAAPFPMALVDRDLRFVAANAALSQIDRTPVAEHAGRLVRDVVAGPVWAVVEPYYQRAARGEAIDGVEVASPSGPGGVSVARALYLRPLLIDGEVDVIAVAVTDFPERRRVAQQLQLRTNLYAMLSRAGRAATRARSAEELYDEVCRLAVDTGRFRFAWIGVPRGGMIEPVAQSGEADDYLAGLEISLDPGDPRSQGPTGRAARGGAPVIVNDFAAAPTTSAWHAAAQRAHLGSSAAFPLKEHGDVVAVLSVYSEQPAFFTDDLVATLSEMMPTVGLALDAFADAAKGRREDETRRSLEEQLRQAQKMEAIGVLAGGVAHDFNNTLTIIRNTCELLLGELDDAALRARVEQIDLAADSAAALTRQLLTFGRRQVVRREALPFDAAIDDTLALATRVLREAITLDVELGAGNACVLMDRGELQQVLLNLAVNARDAMPDGGVLRVRTRRIAPGELAGPGDTAPGAGSRVLLEVGDTGVGMDAATRARAFEPFFTKKETGTGLGLATVYGIVTGSGGAVWVESEPGRGATFSMAFPVTDAPEEVVEHRPGAPASGGHETVLVVEDSDMLRPIVAEMLRSRGYHVLCAAGSDEALAIVRGREGSIDLLLTDVVMPGLNGRELAEQLQAMRPDLRVLFTSGYPADTVVRHGIAAHEVEFVQKPYVAEELIAKVRAVLDEGAA